MSNSDNILETGNENTILFGAADGLGFSKYFSALQIEINNLL